MIMANYEIVEFIEHYNATLIVKCTWLLKKETKTWVKFKIVFLGLN